MKQKSYLDKRQQAELEKAAGDAAEAKASGQYVKEKIYVDQRRSLLRKTKASVSYDANK